MKNAIIIHGIPEKDEELITPMFENYWLPWVKEQLLQRGISTIIPEMPDVKNPKYVTWSSVFKKFNLNEETIIIGHSCGAGFLVRYLSENKINVGKVVLVAPWTDPDKELNTGMFDFIIDPELISRTKGLFIMYSLDDDEVIIKTVNELKVAFPSATFKEYTDKGHFTLEDMGSHEFPELLEILGL